MLSHAEYERHVTERTAQGRRLYITRGTSTVPRINHRHTRSQERRGIARSNFESMHGGYGGNLTVGHD